MSFFAVHYVVALCCVSLHQFFSVNPHTRVPSTPVKRPYRTLFATDWFAGEGSYVCAYCIRYFENAQWYAAAPYRSQITARFCTPSHYELFARKNGLLEREWVKGHGWVTQEEAKKLRGK